MKESDTLQEEMQQVIENAEGILTNTIISGSNVTEDLIVDPQTVASQPQAQPSSLSSTHHRYHHNMYPSPLVWKIRQWVMMLTTRYPLHSTRQVTLRTSHEA